jgi:hypothetical protein
MNCNITISKTNFFIGCDGKPWSNDFIEFHILLAIKEENYEWARKCKNELDRRAKILIECEKGRDDEGV